MNRRWFWLGFLLAFFAVAAIAAGKPLAISLSPATVTVTEGRSATFTLTKSGGNGKPAPAKISAVGASCPATVVPGNSFTCTTADDTIVNGTRSVTISATASTGVKASATLVITDNDVAPPPAMQTCPDGSVILATDRCPAPPAPIVTSWVDAPLQVGGFACNRIQAGHDNVPPCGAGTVMQIIDTVQSSDAVPVTLYLAKFYQDASGQFPVNDAYETSLVTYWQASDLQGMAPAA